MIGFHGRIEERNAQTVTRKPPIGEANLGALIAAVIGSILGLFSLGLAPAIMTGRVQYLAQAPTLNVVCFFFSGITAWFLGGQLGPRFGRLFGEQGGHIAGGIGGGLVPVGAVVALGWYLVTH
jgi:hypothetical protein